MFINLVSNTVEILKHFLLLNLGVWVQGIFLQIEERPTHTSHFFTRRIRVTFHSDKTLPTPPHQLRFVYLSLSLPRKEVTCICDRESEEGGKKEKREVIRFKNSFFSVFLHGCHVPGVEVLCVSRLCYLLLRPSQRYPLLRSDGAMGICCKLLLILLCGCMLHFRVFLR